MSTPAEGIIATVIIKYIWIPIAGALAGLGWKTLWDSSKIRNLRKEVSDYDQKLEDKLTQHAAKVNQLSDEMIELKSKAVSQAEVREIFKESLQPFVQDQKEIKQAVKNIDETLVQVRLTLAAMNATRKGED